MDSNNNLNSNINNNNSITIEELPTTNSKFNIYFNNVLKEKICVKSKYLNENFDDYIYQLLKNKVEGKCIDEGFIKPNSIKIIKKSVGKIVGSRFMGDVTYDVLYTADICNPVIGNIMLCKVKFISKLGILGNNGPISIIVSRQIMRNNDFNKINIGDTIKVEVIKKKFALNDTEIKVAAKLYDENESKNNSFIKKKDEFISSDLTPIMYDENDYDELNSEQDNVNSDDENISVEDENEDKLISDDDLEPMDDNYDDEDDEQNIVELKNPVDEDNDLGMGDIELDEDEDQKEDEIEDNDAEEDNLSEIDYD